MKRTMDLKRFGSALSLAGVLCVLGGCEFMKTERTRLMDPTRVIKAPKQASLVRAIKTTIGAADQDDGIIPGASFPSEGDWTYSDEDYVIGPGDILAISVLDLFREGLETVLQRQVAESGFVDLPLLSARLRAEGATKEQFKERIAQAYSPDVLRKATVSVTILVQRQNAFSILGAVERSGQYNIVRRDLRLLEALSLAGGVVQPNVPELRYIYVIRQSPPIVAGREEDAGADTGELPPLPDILDDEPEPAAPDDATAPPIKPAPPAKPDASAPATGDPVPAPTPKAKEGVDEAALRKLMEATENPGPEPSPSMMPLLSEAGDPTTAPAPAEKTPEPAPPEASEPAGQSPAPAAEPAPGETPPATSDPFGWHKAGKSGMARVLAIDFRKLRQGDPRMNVVIRDKDVVHVPRLEVGEFYMMGEFNRPGVYSLTGRRVTVKMAIAAAGNLGPLAWPENSVLIRRVGNAEEQTIPLNLERIVRGLDEDYFLKPNDVLAVGTSAKAPFLAVLRNAFRMTYGFGFIYDRNFGAYPRNSDRFKRW